MTQGEAKKIKLKTGSWKGFKKIGFVTVQECGTSDHKVTVNAQFFSGFKNSNANEKK
jgi:hypothetical protein